MFNLSYVIVFLYPTATITNRFEFSPQMKALGSISAVKHPFTTVPTRKFNMSVFPWAGPKSVMGFRFWVPILLPSDLNEREKFSLGQTIRCCRGAAIRGGQSTASGHAAVWANSLPYLSPAWHAKSVARSNNLTQTHTCQNACGGALTRTLIHTQKVSPIPTQFCALRTNNQLSAKTAVAPFISSSRRWI